MSRSNKLQITIRSHQEYLYKLKNNILHNSGFVQVSVTAPPGVLPVLDVGEPWHRSGLLQLILTDVDSNDFFKVRRQKSSCLACPTSQIYCQDMWLSLLRMSTYSICTIRCQYDECCRIPNNSVFTTNKQNTLFQS